MLKRYVYLLVSASVATMTSLSACNTAPDSADVQAIAEAKPLVLDVKAGEVLQFALVKTREGEEAKAVRTEYFKTAIPEAESLGDEYLGNLRVGQTLIGANKPRGIAIYAFPNAQAQAKFQSSPNWPKYQEMRKQGWEELHVFSATVPADMQMTFDPTKDYTLAAAWTKPGTLSDYQSYLTGIEADFDKIGARYVARFNDVTLQSHSDTGGNPSQLTFVEWSNGPDLKGLQATDAYKTHSPSFQKAVTRFDFYSLSVPKPS